MEKEHILTVIAGLAVRRGIRRYIMSRGLLFNEDKGWFSSYFSIKGSVKELNSIQDFITDLNKQS